MEFDTNDPKHVKALAMLEGDLIGWFGTVDPHGAPIAVPVWFFWVDGQVVIITQQTSAKVRNAGHEPRTVFHLNAGGPFGDDVVILRGTAEVQHDAAASWAERIGAAYETKYTAALADLRTTMADFIAEYTTVIVFTPHRLIGW